MDENQIRECATCRSEVKRLAERVKILESMKMGEAIARIETTLAAMQLDIQDLIKRTSAFELAGSKKWDKLVWLVVGAAVSTIGALLVNSNGG